MRPSSGEQFSKSSIVDDVDRAVILGNPPDDVGAYLCVCMWMKRGVSWDLTLMSECRKNGMIGVNFNIFGTGRDLDGVFTKTFHGMSFEISCRGLVLQVLVPLDPSDRGLTRARCTCEEVAESVLMILNEDFGLEKLVDW
jgi:hypothetical protein